MSDTAPPHQQIQTSNKARRKWLFLALDVVASGVICSLLADAFIPTYRFHSAVMRMAGNPTAFIDTQAGTNSYADPVSLTSLSDCFDECYRDLKRRFGTPKTYITESASYPVQTSIWQFEQCYLELTAVSANDNDNISANVHSGTFTPIQSRYMNKPWELAPYTSLKSFSIRRD